MSDTNARFQGGSVILPIGATAVTPGNGERAVYIASDGTLTSKLPDGSSAVVGGPPTFGSYFAQLFQNLTGLSPLVIVPYVSNFPNFTDNAVGGAGSGAQGGQASGTGASVAYNSTINNGVISLIGPTSGAGFGDLSLGQGGGKFQISNARTKKWLVAFWIANAHALVAASMNSFGILVNGTTYVGIGGVGAVTTWRYVRGASGAIANVTDTAASIDSSGTVFKWGYIRNDGTNIKVCFDVLAGAAEITGEAASNLASAAAIPYFSVQGTGASDRVELAGYCCFSEF